VVGKNEPNIGVDKALQMLNYGSRARLILPSHLGYGVMGDGDRIGHNLVLVYDLKVENK
ncbi:MAG: FKBP-type peptidyl-prolyl cis-trans isomerase, partial [Bacteroidales bacterium]|nr:FKBP-type peptidyl-prolyl cis-trans isomerase [Bacteroidales bacterium]